MRNGWLSLVRMALIVGLMSGWAAAKDAKDLVLVEQGRAAAVIVVPDQWPLTSQATQAAQILVEHLQAMSGAKLEIRKESQMNKLSGQEMPLTRIFVGESELARQAGFTSEGLGSGSILIQTGDNALALLGPVLPSDPRANHHAVISFLEELGCRYLWPGETGRVIPKRSTITVAPVNRRYTPPLSERGIRWQNMSDRPESGLKRLGLDRATYDAAFARATAGLAGVNWLNWQRTGGALGISGGHAGGGLRGGWKEHGEKHPEWFALQPDGTRDQSKAGNRWRLCVSNPGLIEHVANDVIQRFTEKPGLICVSLSPNDGGNTTFCLCEACKKLDPPEAPKIKMVVLQAGQPKELEVPALTDRQVRYWNAIAERVTKVHPKALLLGEAYSVFSTPPVREKIHPNLVIRYVPASLEGWEGWRQAGARRIYWRPNILLLGRRDGMLVAIQRDLARIIGHMADNGMLATDFDSIVHNWAVHGLNYYVTARLIWDPKLTAEAILEDYAKCGFGPAAEPIRKYWQRVEQVRYFVPTADVTRLEDKQFFTPENISELRSYLAEAAQAAAGNEAIQARIDFLRLGLNYTDLHATLDRLAAAATGQTPAAQAAQRKKAQPLLDLHFLVLRDFVKHHTLALNTSYLLWASGDFSSWDAIGGKAYRPASKILALGDTHRQSGKENSLADLMASFGLDKAPVVGTPAGTTVPATSAGQKKEGSDTEIDADEAGRPVEVLK